MLDNIISLVKGKVSDMIGSHADIPEQKKNLAVETTTSSIIEGLKDYVTPENLTSLSSLLGIAGTNNEGSPEVRQNGITKGVESNVVTSLMSKVGLNQASASKIAMMVVPAVMALLSKKTNDGTSSGFNLSSLVSAFSGKDRKGAYEEGESVMEKVGSFFGK